MKSVRNTLFCGKAIQVGQFEARPRSDACGDVERQSSNVVVLPVSGVFSRHDGPNRHAVGTPSHAVFIAADIPYRISFPAAIGDRALLLKFGPACVDEQRDWHEHGAARMSHGLLPASAILLRNLLWFRLRRAKMNEFEAEALSLDLLGMSFSSMHARRRPLRSSAVARRMRALERVREAVALDPAENWTVAKLAKVAGLSPFHLCHVFREAVGASIYDYVVQERLAHALDAVLNGADLMTLALDTGFASHSHLTARFRRFFGCTPTELRRAATAGRVAELRKIVTASRRLPA